MNSQYYTFTTPINGGNAKSVLTFLGNAGQTCTEAWILAKSSNGNLEVRLTDVTNSERSDTVTINSSTLERTKLLNVNIPASDFPEQINLTVTNNGDAAAVVQGLLLVWQKA